MSGLVATRRVLHFLLLTGLAGAVAVLSQSWVPATVILPLMGALLVGMFEVLLPLPRWARREVGTGVMLREDELDVTVRMGFCVMPYNLTIRERFPEGLELKDHSQEPIRIMQHRVRGRKNLTLEGKYVLRARRRGDWDLGACRVVRTSMLGLFERGADLPTSTNATVLPVTAQQRNMKLAPKPLTPEGIPTRSGRRGPGDTFYALREYQPGDNMGDVNWKATARMGKPITNEYLPDEPARYLIYVDTRSFGAEVGKVDAFERTLELGAVLLEGLVGAHAHVGLVLLSGQAQFKVPASGAVHMQKVRRMILNAVPGAEAPLLQLVEGGAPHLPRRTSAILVTPNVYEPTLQQTLTFLRAHHGNVLLLVPAFPEPEADRESAERAAGALLNADQAAVLADLRNYVDGAAQWPPGQSIVMTLARLGLIGRMRGGSR